MTLQLEHALVGCVITDIPWLAFLKVHFHISFKFTSFTVYFSHPTYRSMRVLIILHILQLRFIYNTIPAKPIGSSLLGKAYELEQK